MTSQNGQMSITTSTMGGVRSTPSCVLVRDLAEVVLADIGGCGPGLGS
jgi:hypothetical protein